MTFKRARNEEQRTERRRAILATAAAMLREMPVAQVSLNELSRRTCLAKSNVLRYFESREAVLLELLDTETRDWLDQLDPLLTEAVDSTADARARGDQVAAALADAAAARPMLCDLLSAQAAVLEHNVSPEVAARYKRATIENIHALATLVLRRLPELGEPDAVRFAGAAAVITGAVWAHSQPSPAMLAAYQADPELAALRLDFTATVREVLETLVAGLLARRPD
jgi:AcrR family transcriptional regulator